MYCPAGVSPVKEESEIRRVVKVKVDGLVLKSEIEHLFRDRYLECGAGVVIEV